jgi:chaperonin GroEL (HSP60 family)
VNNLPNLSTTNVFSPKYEYLKGKESWRNNLRQTANAADRIRSSMGPNGAYKMVTYNRGPEKVVKITKDSVAVLDELATQYPTLTVLSEAAKIQRQEFGDGVKSFIILTAALLKKADELIGKGIHPQKILKGYQEAAKKAIEIMTTSSQPLGFVEFGNLLETVDCGRGCVNEEIGKMIIEAVNLASKEGKLNKDKIRIIRNQGGSRVETELIKGVVIKKSKLHPNMPDSSDNPTIVITSQKVGINRLEIKMPGEGPFHLKYNMTKADNLSDFGKAEKERKAQAINKLADFAIKVLFSQQPIDNFSKSKLSEMGILAFENVDRKDLDLVSKATKTQIVGNLLDLSEKDIGHAEKLDTGKIGLEKTLTITGCNFLTFIIRGSNPVILDELELLIENSLTLIQAALISNKIVLGGGAIEMQLARQLNDFSLQFSGREQLAIRDFADALLEIPRNLAMNNGLNSDDAILQLRKLHSEGLSNYGISSENICGKTCIELLDSKKAVVRRACEVASLMLRIDEQIISKEIPKFHKK